MIPQNLGELLSASAAHHSRRTAIVFGSKKISYSQLDELTSRLARGLVAAGMGKGVTIALLLDNCPEFIISYYACLKAGCTVVPVNFMFKMEEAKFILQDSRAVALITSRAYLEMAKELLLRVDSLKYVICVNKTKEPGSLDFEKLRKAHGHTALPQVEPSDLAVILYTSGTTGHPKGAMLSHYNLISNVADCSTALKITTRDCFICILPLFHSFAATVCMNLPLFKGSRIVLMKSVKPFKRVIRAVRKNRVSLFVGIPSIYGVLTNVKLPRILHTPLIRLFNPVKVCVSGAAALPADIFKNFQKKFRVALVEGYGLTEASPVVTLNPVKGVRKPGSIGLALSKNISLKIVDEHDREVEPGKVGELLVKGPNVMQGYLRQDEENKRVLRNGWLYTGDMARMDRQRYVYIAGRKKEMVNVRGLNVYPREIEEVLYQNPKVKEAAVIGIPDPHRGEVPKGFVVLQDGVECQPHELLVYLRQRLAPYKVPRTIELRKSLPKNSTGKILKRLLQDEENQKGR